MNHEQMKYLKERIRKLNQRKHDATFQRVPLPKPVAAAKRVMDGWAAKQRRIVAARHAALEKAYAKAYQAILFQDPEHALKAMQEFETFQP